MRNLVPTLRAWRAAGTPFGLARVVSTWGSAPRRPGAWLAVSSDGDMVGSVSGGCIEGAARDEILDVLDGAPARVVEYGIDNATAWTAGLSCGGKLAVSVQPFPETVGDALLNAIELGDDVVWTSHFTETGVENALGPADAWPGAPNAVMMHQEEPAGTVVAQRIRRPGHVLIIGGADIAVHLVQLAHLLDFDTTIVDPRAVFTSPDRFPVPPTAIHTAWPQEVLPSTRMDRETYAVLLTHDPKIDDPAIALLFASDVAYIGALGGRNTQEKRRQRLAQAGHDPSDIDRIKGPVGLSIGAATPAEIALSIIAEIVAVSRRS